jgi:hypothetical protein
MTLGDGIILFHRLIKTLGGGLVVSVRFNMTVNVGKVTFGRVGKSREMKVYCLSLGSQGKLKNNHRR